MHTLTKNDKSARLLRAMSNPHRLTIFQLLQELGEVTVGELTLTLPLSQSAVSQHLAILRKEELVKTRRSSQTIFYSMADERVGTLLQVLDTLHSTR